jgi:hypothetical protein
LSLNLDELMATFQDARHFLLEHRTDYAAAVAGLQIPMKSASCSDAMSAMHSDFKPAMIPI